MVLTFCWSSLRPPEGGGAGVEKREPVGIKAVNGGVRRTFDDVDHLTQMRQHGAAHENGGLLDDLDAWLTCHTSRDCACIEPSHLCGVLATTSCSGTQP